MGATTKGEPSTELAVFDPSSSNFPILFDQGEDGGIAQVLADNFGDEGFSAGDLDRVKVPAGGGQAWDIPDEDPQRAIEGVIIHKQPTRSFWINARGEGGEEDGPPDCYSPDAKVGVGAFGPGSEGNPTGACADCPMNVFGSATRGSGNGKACKEQMQVFVLRPESILPLQISLPPTSLKGFRKYMTRLAAKGKPFYGVVTRFKLEVEKGGGQTYSVVVPELGAVLSDEERRAAQAYGGTIRASLESAQRAREQAAAEQAAGGTPEQRPGWPTEDGQPADEQEPVGAGAPEV